MEFKVSLEKFHKIPNIYAALSSSRNALSINLITVILENNPIKKIK